MEITLISKEQHSTLLNLMQDNEGLILENKGYQYIRRELTNKEVEAKQQVVNILKNHIKGFNSFTNFRHHVKTGKPQIRFDYAYSSSFSGVGYIKIDELLNGFDK